MTDKMNGNGPGFKALRKRLIGASAYITGAQIVLMGLNFGVLVLLTRYLTLKQLGIYMILLEIGRIASIFCQAGVSQSSQKFLGRMLYRTPEQLPLVQRRIMLTLLGATIVTVVVCAGVWNLAAYEVFRGKGLQGLAFFGCTMIVVMTLQNYHAAVLRAINRMLESVLSIGLVQKIILLLGIVYVMTSDGSVNGLYLVLWVWFVAGLASILIGGAMVHFNMRRLRRPGDRSAKTDLPGFTEILFTSLPMAVASGTVTVRNSVDILIVGAVLGPASAGRYGPVRRIGNLALLVSQAGGKSLPATVVAAYRESPLHEVEGLCRTAANYGALAAIPIALAFIIGGGPILGLFFGREFADYGLLVAVVLLGVLVKTLAGSPGALLQMTGHERLVMYINGAITVISISAMAFVAQAFGLVGMASLYSGSLTL